MSIAYDFGGIPGTPRPKVDKNVTMATRNTLRYPHEAPFEETRSSGWVFLSLQVLVDVVKHERYLFPAVHLEPE